MGRMPDGFVDFAATSPPYGSLRDYKGYDFDFPAIATSLFRVMKPGGVVVWVVADQTTKFCESLASFKQVVYFVDVCGFKLVDTMIFQKLNYRPLGPGAMRYDDVFDYMFVLAKGRPKTFHPIRWPKTRNRDEVMAVRSKNGTLTRKPYPKGSDTKMATNIWPLHTAGIRSNHPAVFPEELATRHILSWSNPGDVVYDPMCGSGTTLKAALVNGRRFIGSDVGAEYCLEAEGRLLEYVFANSKRGLSYIDVCLNLVWL